MWPMTVSHDRVLDAIGAELDRRFFGLDERRVDFRLDACDVPRHRCRSTQSPGYRQSFLLKNM